MECMNKTESSMCVYEAPVMAAIEMLQVIVMGKRGILGNTEERSLIQGWPKYERISKI